MKLMRPVTPAMLERDRIRQARLHNHWLYQWAKQALSATGEIIGGVFFFGALIFIIKMLGAMM